MQLRGGVQRASFELHDESRLGPGGAPHPGSLVEALEEAHAYQKAFPGAIFRHQARSAAG